jgi:hypothetical protein
MQRRLTSDAVDQKYLRVEASPTPCGSLHIICNNVASEEVPHAEKQRELRDNVASMLANRVGSKPIR